MKWIGSSDIGDVANASMMRGVTVTTCSSASAGAVSFVAFSNDGRSKPVTFNPKDISKIALYLLLLCRIIANGENFKFYGGLYFMSYHLTMVANPCAAFYRDLTWICEIASSYNADKWGPLVTAAYKSSGAQSRPTETRRPTRAYCSNKFAAGCCLALRLVNTRPRKFPSMNPYGPVNSLSNRRWSSANAVSNLFSHQCRDPSVG